MSLADPPQEGPEVTMQETDMDARMSVLHASPGAPAFDIYFDGCLVIEGLAYGALSQLIVMPADRHRLAVFAGGVRRPEAVLLDRDLALLKPGWEYTLAIVGEPDQMQATLLGDTTPAPGGGRAWVRVLHASPDAPAVDVGIAGGPVLFRQVPFTQATPFVEVATGPLDLEMRRAGHMEVVARVAGYPLSGDNRYTFVATGYLDGEPGFTILPLAEPVRRCEPV